MSVHSKIVHRPWPPPPQKNSPQNQYFNKLYKLTHITRNILFFFLFPLFYWWWWCRQPRSVLQWLECLHYCQEKRCRHRRLNFVRSSALMLNIWNCSPFWQQRKKGPLCSTFLICVTAVIKSGTCLYAQSTSPVTSGLIALLCVCVCVCVVCVLCVLGSSKPLITNTENL